MGSFSLIAIYKAQECPPARFRGFLGACYSIGIVLGTKLILPNTFGPPRREIERRLTDSLSVQSLGNLVGMIVATFCVQLGDKRQYRVLLAVTIPLPVIILSSTFFLPESPRWLLLRDQNEKAMRSLQRLRPSFQPTTSAKHELLEMKAAIGEEKRQTTGSVPRDIVLNPVNRRRATMSVVVELTERATGLLGRTVRLSTGKHASRLYPCARIWWSWLTSRRP